MDYNGYNKFYIGIDNGVSGSIGIIAISPTLPMKVTFQKTPVIKQQNYTKAADNISRIDTPGMIDLFNQIPVNSEIHCLIERPMVNPKMFKATLSAIRALEATQVILEAFKIPFQFLDSKEWQKATLPSGTKGDDLKFQSLQVAERYYPGKLIKGHKDADGLLIAHYCYIKNK